MNKKAFLLAAFTIIFWASSFAGVRVSILGGFSPAHLVLIRFIVASGVFLLYALLPGVHFHLPRKKDIVHILLLGWTGITIYHVGLTFSVQMIPAGTASMIVGAAPIFTAIIAFFFLKERLTIFSWIGLGVGFVGIILITIGSAGPALTLSKGSIIMIVATIATSVFFVFQKPLLTRFKPIELTAYFTWAGTLPMFFFAPGVIENIHSSTLEAKIAAVFVGVFPAAIAYATWAIALSLSNASSVASMMYVEPAIAIIIAWFWLKEWPSTLSLIGGIIALSSVFIVNKVSKNGTIPSSRNP